MPLLPLLSAWSRSVEARNEDRNSARRRPVSAAETATGAFSWSSGRRERGRWGVGRQLRAHCTRGHITRQEKSEKSEQCGFQAELCEEADLAGLKGKETSWTSLTEEERRES